MLSLFLLLLGLVLIIIEIFVPGFGIPGVTGIISLILFSIITAIKVPYGIFIVIGVFFVIGILLTILIKHMKHNQNLKKIILNECLESEPDEFGELDNFLGKEGIALCPLKPFGKAEFNGVRFDVISDGQYIKPGQKVKIVDINKKQIIVREVL